MIPDFRFQHHGEPVETREQWIARQAASHLQVLAEAERRTAEAARRDVEAQRLRTEAEQAQALRPHTPSAVPPSVRPQNTRRVRVVAVALVACTGVGALVWASREEPPPVADGAAASSPSAPSRPDIPRPIGPLASRPRAEVEFQNGGHERYSSWADAPTIDPAPNGWWCICYKIQAGADHTACRRLAGECSALFEMVQTEGSASILRGSATAACRYVPGAYPWQRLGHRPAWTTSSYPGATQAPGVCAL